MSLYITYILGSNKVEPQPIHLSTSPEAAFKFLSEKTGLNITDYREFSDEDSLEDWLEASEDMFSFFVPYDKAEPLIELINYLNRDHFKSFAVKNVNIGVIKASPDGTFQENLDLFLEDRVL